MTQPSKPETPEKSISEGQDKPQGTSAESPKASQPTCLRGGFTRLFLKRTEQNNAPEDSSINNQNTEDIHGIRGKKRRVLGGNIFRLPCFRSAERTDTGEHNKGQLDGTEQQCHQTASEEDLKPYSKASFLKKIRGYRLMREREATEKLKVIEVDQRNEGSVVGEPSKKHLELGRKVAEHEKILSGKGKAVQKLSLESRRTKSNDKNQGSHSELKRDEGNTIQKQECQDKNIRDLEETVYGKESHGEKEDGKKHDLAEHLSQAEKVEKLEQDLQEQGNKADGEKEEGDMTEQENPIAIAEDQSHKTTKQLNPIGREMEPTKNSLENQQVDAERVQETKNTFSQQSEDSQTNKMGAVANDLTGQGLKDSMEKPSNVLPEAGSPKTMVTELEKGLLEQKSNTNNEEKVGAESRQKEYAESAAEMKKTLLGQVGHADVPEDLQCSGCSEDSRKKEDELKETVGNVAAHKSHPEKLEESEHSSVGKDNHEKLEKEHFREEFNSPGNVGQRENCHLEDNNHIHIVVETGGHSVEKDGLIQKETKPRDHLQEENVHGIRDCLIDQESHTKKGEESEGQVRCSENGEAKMPPQDGYEKLEGETKVTLLEKCTDNEGGSSDHLPEQEAEKMEELPLLEENNCVKDLRKLEKVLSSQGKNSSVKDEILITHIICTAPPEEPHAELPTFKANKAAKAVHFYKQETNQGDIKDGDNGMMECENTDWASLQVEVKDMVQWLVDEASGRLTDLATDFTQDPPSTEYNFLAISDLIIQDIIYP